MAKGCKEQNHVQIVITIIFILFANTKNVFYCYVNVLLSLLLLSFPIYRHLLRFRTTNERNIKFQYQEDAWTIKVFVLMGREKLHALR